MLYAVLGDIHSNFEALEAVLEDIKKEKPDEILSVGDIVGYAAEPSRCIKTTRETTSIIVAGNHDYAAVGKMDVNWFNPEAREAAIWTANQLAKEEKDFLSNLPLIAEKDGTILVHSSLYEPEAFSYIRTVYEAELCLKELKRHVCFIGHSHLPIAILRDPAAPEAGGEALRIDQGPEVGLERVEKAIINVGSVGQPRDRNPRACYVLYDTEKKLARFRRIDYDVTAASSKILKAGLPRLNAERLKWGI